MEYYKITYKNGVEYYAVRPDDSYSYFSKIFKRWKPGVCSTWTSKLKTEKNRLDLKIERISGPMVGLYYLG